MCLLSFSAEVLIAQRNLTRFTECHKAAITSSQNLTTEIGRRLTNRRPMYVTQNGHCTLVLRMTPRYVFTRCNIARTASIVEFLECRACEVVLRSCHTAAFARVQVKLRGRRASLA